MDEEGLRTTENELIHIGKPLKIDEAIFSAQMSELSCACENNAPHIRQLVTKIVPTYRVQAKEKDDERTTESLPV